MIQDKKKNTKVMVGKVRHIGPHKSARCSIVDPNHDTRSWVLRSGQETGLLSLEESATLYQWIMGNPNLEFVVVSSNIKAAGDSGAPVAAPTTTVDPKHLERLKKKAEGKATKPTPANEPVLTPREELEAIRAKEEAERANDEPQVEENDETVDEPITDEETELEGDPQEQEPEAQEADTKEPDEEVDLYECLRDLDYETVVELAKMNDVDLGRTSSLRGALNKIYKHLEENGEEGFVTVPAD